LGKIRRLTERSKWLQEAWNAPKVSGLAQTGWALDQNPTQRWRLVARRRSKAERRRWLGCHGRHALSRAYVWANVHSGSVRCSRVQAKENPSTVSWNVRTRCFEIRGVMRWFCLCTHVQECARAKMAPCPSCASRQNGRDRWLGSTRARKRKPMA
jgi:hypothetical protein